jgi:hypothetical protein
MRLDPFEPMVHLLNNIFICGQVDEDIEALDERTEDNRKDCDAILDSLKALEARVDAAAGTAAKAAPQGPSPADIRQEIESVLLGKDLVTKSDLSRGLKTIPFGLSKEEVSQMIEFATRNFLRTVQGTYILYVQLPMAIETPVNNAPMPIY